MLYFLSSFLVVRILLLTIVSVFVCLSSLGVVLCFALVDVVIRIGRVRDCVVGELLALCAVDALVVLVFSSWSLSSFVDAWLVVVLEMVALRAGSCGAW